MKKAILINDTATEKHIGSKTVVQNIKILCKQNNIEIIKYFRRTAVKDRLNTIKSAIDECDLIIVNGEGSLHHTPLWFVKLLEIIPDKKPAVLINTLWQKMFLKDINMLDKFNLISVREGYSYNELLKVYPKKEKIFLTPDLVFYNGNNSSKIGYGDSVIDSLKESLSENKNYFPLNFVRGIPTFEAYISWLKSLDIYITGRFHGVCMAIIAETPFLSFPSNSHKIESLLNDMNCNELLIKSFNDIKTKKKIANKAMPKILKYKNKAQDDIENLFRKIYSLRGKK